ncbi:MAG: CHASE2 domain-containing protein, partial [Planctomycetota bacterium]
AHGTTEDTLSAARAIRRRAIGAAWTGGRVAIAVALGVALALTLGRKVTFEWTPAHAWYASLLGPPPSSLDRSMELTAVLGLTDETDLGGLFEAAGLEGYDPRDVYSLRTLHGWVCERLAVADPAAVVFDIRFGETSRAVAETEALARGVGALETAGIPVVMGSRSWFLDDEGRPDFAGAIWNAGADRGVIHALDPAGGDLLFMPIAAQRGETTHGMGLALAAFCAVRQPGTSPAFELEESLHRVDISYRAPSAGRPDLIVDLPERERVTLVSVNRLEGARRHGLLPGDLMGTYAPTVYSEEAVRGASLDYGELAEMGDDRLRRAVDGRVVVIGDRREGRDVRVSLAGRTVDGVDLHAMTIESLLRGAPLRAFNEPAAYLVVTLAALGGVFVALGCGVVTARLPRTLRRVGLSHAVRWGVLVGVSAALVVIAVQAYRLEGIVMNALIAAIALIVASELAALLFPRRPIARTA